jgi:tRNA dimethylallyltransferase
VTCLEKKEIKRIVSGFAIEAERQLRDDLQGEKKRVIVIAGPTSVGKTSFSIELAKLLDGEIISADSMQVYHGMDVGTAKASQEERDKIPHHLIDIRDLDDPFNVVDFYYEARHHCQEIIARKKVPIVAGGSGFYLHSFIFGPPNGPPSVPELRKTLELELEQIGSEAMYERLKKLDPQYANTITKHDKQKIARALEIIALTGKNVSKLSWKNRVLPQNYEFHCWFLYRPRENLYRLVDKRCEKMVEEGLLDEVKSLLPKGLLSNSSAAQAIGYRQAIEFLNTKQTKEDFHHFLESFKTASRHYVKRQFTWFRKENFQWLDLDVHDLEVALDIVVRDYESRR